MQQKVIIEVRSGTIQRIISNGDVCISVVDWDIINHHVTEADLYHRCEWVEEMNNTQFKEIEHEIKSEWNDTIDELLNLAQDA